MQQGKHTDHTQENMLPYLVRVQGKGHRCETVRAYPELQHVLLTGILVGLLAPSKKPPPYAVVVLSSMPITRPR